MEPEDPNLIEVGARKKMCLSGKTLLPADALPSQDPINHDDADKLATKSSAYQEDDSGSENDEDFDGLPRYLRGPLFEYSFRKACGHLTKIWDQVMTYPLSEDQYKRCLVFVPEHVMDYHIDPIKFTDFFINCYNKGNICIHSECKI